MERWWKMNKKTSMKVLYKSDFHYGKSVENVARMLITFDPFIHDKIEIEILSSQDQKKIQQLESEIERLKKDNDL